MVVMMPLNAVERVCSFCSITSQSLGTHRTGFKGLFTQADCIKVIKVTFKTSRGVTISSKGLELLSDQADTSPVM